MTYWMLHPRWGVVMALLAASAGMYVGQGAWGYLFGQGSYRMLGAVIGLWVTLWGYMALSLLLERDQARAEADEAQAVPTHAPYYNPYDDEPLPPRTSTRRPD